MIVDSRSEEETRALGRQIGARLRPGDCLALSGPLGVGKTVVAQGIVAGAGGGHDVRSPTFVLHAIYPGRLPIHHFDLFRLQEGIDLGGFGMEEMLIEGAAVVEWPERASGDWFNGQIELEIASATERRIHLQLRPGLGNHGFERGT